MAMICHDHKNICSGERCTFVKSVFQSFNRVNSATVTFFGIIKYNFREAMERCLLRIDMLVTFKWHITSISVNPDKDVLDGHLTNKRIFYNIPALSKGTPKSVLTVQGLCCTA